MRDGGGGTEAGRLRLRATTLPTVSRYGWPRSGDECRAFLASFLANYHRRFADVFFFFFQLQKDLTDIF